jgi:DNA adenine methylase
MQHEMHITAIAPWFGSKRVLAHRIIAELGPHRAYWEPFCGSMSVLLAKVPVAMETVNDMHGDLINLARVLADEAAAVELHGRLSRMLVHEDLFHEAAERWKARGHQPAKVPDIDRAYDFFVCSWMGRNGVAGTQSYNQGFCVRYTKNGGHAATRFRSCVESIPAWHERLRTVTSLNRDGFELLERIEDAPGVAIYLDPPYLTKGAKYVHDLTWLDHRRLAKLAARFERARVVVSYYEHPDLAELYPAPAWSKVSCPTTKAMVNQGGAVMAPEVLLVNGPSLSGGAQ